MRQKTRLFVGYLVLVMAMPLIACTSTETNVKKEGDTGGSMFDLRRQLRSTDAAERKAAALALGKMGDKAEKAIPALQRTLLDARPEVRLAAVGALSQIGPKAAPALLYAQTTGNAEVAKAAKQGIARLGPQRVPALIEALKDPLARVRSQAAKALGALGAEAANAATPVAKLLDDEEPDVRVAAADALRGIGAAHAATPNITMSLGAAIKKNKSWWRVRVAIAKTLESFGPKAAAVAAEIVPMLSARDKNVHKAALSALMKIGPKSLPALKRAFPTVPWQAKVRIARVAGHFGTLAAGIVPTLSQGLRDADSDVRKATIAALLKMGIQAREAIPALKSVLNDTNMSRENWLGCLQVMLSIGEPGAETLKNLIKGNDWALRKKLIEGMAELGPKIGDYGVPVLVTALEHKEKEVRWVAAMVLRKLKSQASTAVSALMTALKAPDATTRKLAAKALGAIGAEAASAIPALKQRLGDGDASVKQAAQDAISKIQAAQSTAGKPDKAPTPPR